MNSHRSNARGSDGTEDPENRKIIPEDTAECPLDSCNDDNCTHFVLYWYGEQYNDAWIAAEEDSRVDTEELR